MVGLLLFMAPRLSDRGSEAVPRSPRHRPKPCLRQQHLKRLRSMPVISARRF
ncbi:hypothetical protein DAI22_12g143200 [Oryza sativa Japonica Group]|nr:hypothetical protein DAI22_12g143200 [Oryza sativa Japonica Group]